GGPPPTSIEMVDRQIKLSTGEASIILDGPNVTITAQGAISLHALDSITVLSEKEVAIASRGKAAIVSATDDVIVQAQQNVHLNPYEGSGKLKKAVRIEGHVQPSDRTEIPICATCQAPMESVDGRWVCTKVSVLRDGEGHVTLIKPD
ncbi:MAG TPA: hypothetical protein VLS89_13510, partial [Candidatus Nanopelagicales bacterium]|nr:hypothetical protein [Candidatus Nanopelagicales bacterium]